MKNTLERELKLDVDAGFVLPDLPGEAIESRVFTSTYHDTPPRSLGRAGITLRRRVENGKSLWQLKLPRAEGRAELEEPGGPAGPPDGIARLLLGHRRHGPLEPVATLRTRRSGVCIEGVAEVTVDQVDVLDAGRSAGGFAEVEIELVNGGAETDLDRLGKVLRKRGARRSDGTPKLMRVLRLPGTEPTHRLRDLLEEQLRTMEAHDPGARLGDDPEDVHKFRVATRRARALIRATRPLLGEALTPLSDELRWLARVLGEVRDLDVLLERLGRCVARLDADEAAGHELLLGLECDRELARARLLDALASPRYTELLESFDAALPGIPPLEDVDAIARDAVRKLRRMASKLGPDPSNDELHALRIEAKRARYAAELGGAKRSVEALKGVQDIIGEHQDAVVAEEKLRRLARAKTAVAAGRLIELERARRHGARATYGEALDAAIAAGRKAFG